MAAQTKANASVMFKTNDAIQLGMALIDIADQYPTVFLTERDFFPLVVAYLYGRVPGVTPEHAVTSGAIDFRLGGTNPSVLELAVAPRALVDSLAPTLTFPGHGTPTQLYASQNRSELKKLAAEPPSKAKKRYLLLLDFQAKYDKGKLRALYEAEATKTGLANPVVVVYVSRKAQFCFTLRKSAPRQTPVPATSGSSNPAGATSGAKSP